MKGGVFEKSFKMHFLAAAWWGAFNISSLFAKQVAPEKAQILQDLLLAASHLKAPDNEQSDKLTNLLGDKLAQLPISQMLQLKCCTEKNRPGQKQVLDFYSDEVSFSNEFLVIGERKM